MTERLDGSSAIAHLNGQPITPELAALLADLADELMLREAEASAALDRESPVHTCYAGHDCGDRAAECPR